MIVLFSLMGCRKELCYDDHANEVDLQLEVAYSLDWHLPWDENWNDNWPDEWEVDWGAMKPGEPESVRLHTFDSDKATPVSNYNLAREGGRIGLNCGRYDMLLYNSDTEGVLFENMDAVSDASATTRTHTRAAYSNRYPGEMLVSPPDILFAAYLPEYEMVRPADGQTLYLKINVELVPRTWTYLIRYEFTSGQEYVEEAKAYLSGMAGKVCLKDGCTNDDKIVTLLLDCSASKYGVETIARSFGLPGFDYQMINKGSTDDRKALSNVTTTNKLVLEMKLLSGMVKVMEFDVTDQLRRQPRGGVVVVKDIVVTKEEGQRPGGSGFEGDVNDWEENIDIDVPIS